MSDDNKINIDLNGIDLSDEEKNELEILLKERLIEFLQGKAKPVVDITALGPGWIGIET